MLNHGFAMPAMRPSKRLKARAKCKCAAFTAHSLALVNQRFAVATHKAPKTGSTVLQRHVAGHAAPRHYGVAYTLASSIE